MELVWQDFHHSGPKQAIAFPARAICKRLSDQRVNRNRLTALMTWQKNSDVERTSEPMGVRPPILFMNPDIAVTLGAASGFF